METPMGLLPDWEIKRLAEAGMISPFVPELVRAVEYDDDPFALNRPRSQSPLRKVISYGLSSAGYDLRLSAKEFRVFQHIPGTIINPKQVDPRNMQLVDLQSDEYGEFFVIPGNSYGLGVAVEHLDLPLGVTAIFLGKSSYARCGLIANITPGETKWRGHLTLEFSNSSPADCRIYANEGVVQALFFRGEPCETSYEARAGKYQNQPEAIVLAKV